MYASKTIVPVANKKNKGNSFFKSNQACTSQPFFQAKLSIGPVEDAYEREADAVADQVMRVPDSQVIQTKISPLGVQRSCSACEKEEKEKLQRKSKPSTTNEAPAEVHQALNAGGQALDSETKSFMESRFAHDFSQVKIHTDAIAAKSAAAINALAYTSGNHVVFNAGQYAPATENGKRLLAHELTHVVQQGASKEQTIQRHTLENDPATAPPMSCQIATSSPSGLSLDIIFAKNSSALTPSDLAAVDNFVNNWHLTGGTEPVRVDGYASIEGGPGLNWPLSCSRAEILANELMTPTSGITGIPAGFIDVFANGETDLFSSSTLDLNRRAAATIPLPIPPPPPATAAVFSESAVQVFQGYDNTITPNFQVVPVGETRIADVTVAPAGAAPTFVSLNPAIATVSATATGVEITGVADGATRIEARQGATVLDTLRIEVKAQRAITVDYHFMSDTPQPARFFGFIPAQPQHQTVRPAASAPGLTATLNRIWQRQSNVQFTTGTVDSPTVPKNLGNQVVGSTSAAPEWVDVTSFSTGGDWNVYLVWEFELVASAGVDAAHAGTAASDTLVEDNDCPDGTTLPHEGGHFLSGATLPHTGTGIMSPCGPIRDRVRKNEADAVNL